MALNKQIHIYSVDTQAFYNAKEKNLHRKMVRCARWKNGMKQHWDDFRNDAVKQKKFDDLYKLITSSKTKYKEELKNAIADNKDVRELDISYLQDKNVISIFDSALTRIMGVKEDTLTKDIIVVQTYFYDIVKQIIHNGFTLDGERYIYFTSSAGQIRTKKTVFIREAVFKQYADTIMCGLSIDKINMCGGININKFLAYLALTNSATDKWENFDIDRCIVVPDFETNVNGLVDYISDETYSIERKTMDVPITHTDGCGMILPKLSKKNFMVRLPWVKGLLATFDFRKFIQEYGCSPIVTDIYGKDWNIIDDDIEVIFTESQFKMYKYYENWDKYKSDFNKYHCQAGICNMEENFIPYATINYQMMQTLTDITDEETSSILSSSCETIKNLASDRDTMMKVFGAVKYNHHRTSLQEALMLYPELLQDEYCKYTIRQMKKSLINDYRHAKIEIKGKYTFLIPDLFAFCEHLFKGVEVPEGLLRNGEVYCRIFRNANKLDCLRSPHLYREHAVRYNVIDGEKSKWFNTDAIYTSSHDLISKVLQFDNDGDKSLVVADETFVKVAERNVVKDNIVPLYYKMRKAEPVIITNDSIYDGLNAAYTGGNIGIISNNISKIWNFVKWHDISEEEKQQALAVIKLLCMENNFTIDYAKTLYKPVRPENIDTIMKSYTNMLLPHFFIYAKDKDECQVEKNCNSLVDSFEGRIKSSPIRFNMINFGKFDYHNLLFSKLTKIDEKVVEKFNELNKQYHFKLTSKNNDNINYIISECRNELLSMGYDEPELVDMIIKSQYKYGKKTERKRLLWSCFGWQIVENLKYNLRDTRQCTKCGNRFVPESDDDTLCPDCFKIEKENNRLKVVKCIDCGKEFMVNINSRYIRCADCRRKHRNDYNLEQMKTRRCS